MSAPPSSPPSPHAVRTWRSAWQGRVRVALNDANRAVKDWEVRQRALRGALETRPAPAAGLIFIHPSISSQTAVREGGLAAAGVGNAAMQEE